MKEMRNVRRILVGKHERKRSLSGLRFTREFNINIKMNLKETECEYVDWIRV